MRRVAFVSLFALACAEKYGESSTPQPASPAPDAGLGNSPDGGQIEVEGGGPGPLPIDGSTLPTNDVCWDLTKGLTGFTASGTAVASDEGVELTLGGGGEGSITRTVSRGFAIGTTVTTVTLVPLVGGTLPTDVTYDILLTYLGKQASSSEAPASEVALRSTRLEVTHWYEPGKVDKTFPANVLSPTANTLRLVTSWRGGGTTVATEQQTVDLATTPTVSNSTEFTIRIGGVTRGVASVAPKIKLVVTRVCLATGAD